MIKRAQEHKSTGAQEHKLILFFFACVFAVSLFGCESKEEFTNEVTLSRESAYKQWEGRKEAEKQTQPMISGTLTLDDCLKLALTNNKTLLKTIEEREAARGGEVGSYTAILPRLDLSAGYQRLDRPQSFTVAGNKLELGDADNYSLGLRVTQPIFAGGAIPARINAGRLSVLLADQAVRNAVQETVYAAQLGYYTVLLDQQLYNISEDAVKSSQAHLNDVKQKRAAGVASDYDVLRSEVDLSNFTAQLIQSRNAINVAKASLIKIMGVSQDSVFTPGDKLIYSAYKITMEEAVGNAYRNRPDLFTKELTIRQQKELLTIARSTYYPAVNGYFNDNWTRPDPHDPMLNEWGGAWNFGFAASWPIFDGFSREGNVITQKARLKQSQIDLVDTEETALFELTRTILSIEDTAEFVDSQKFNLSRATEGLRLVEAGYRQGVNTQVEVIDAQTALTTARANYYQSIYSHDVAKLDLQRAMGTLTRFESSTMTQTASDANNVQPEQKKK
jgi:outer membrane protein